MPANLRELEKGSNSNKCNSYYYDHACMSLPLLIQPSLLFWSLQLIYTRPCV